jgi:hypothetical protein
VRAAVAALAAAAAATALAGCGGDEGSALDEALGYLPEDAPVVVVVETDPDHPQWENLDDLISKFRFAGQFKEGAKSELAPEPLDFDDDIEPQLGNEAVIGMPDPAAEDSFVAAVKLKDAERAERDIVPQLRESGNAAEVDGDMLLVADDKQALDAARERHDGDDRLTADKFEDDLGRLGEGDPIFRMTLDVQAALEEEDEAGPVVQAIPWVRSLRRLAITGSVHEKSLAFDFEQNAEATPEGDLPLAPGAESPPVPARRGEVVFGVREPGRGLTFAERVRAALPRTDAHSKALDDALGRIGVSVERDLIAPIGATGAASFSVDGTSVARADLEDPARFRRALETMATELEGAARGDVGFTIEPGGGEGFYRLDADGGRQLFVGVVGDRAALGTDAARARAFAEAGETARVPGARGSVAFFADGEDVAREAIAANLSGTQAILAEAFVDPLGDLRGWIETRRDGMTGHLELGVE